MISDFYPTWGRAYRTGDLLDLNSVEGDDRYARRNATRSPTRQGGCWQQETELTSALSFQQTEGWGGGQGGKGIRRRGAGNLGERGRMEGPSYCCSKKSGTLQGASFLVLPLPLWASEGEQWGWNPCAAAWRGWAHFLRAPPRGMLSCPGCVEPAGKTGAGGSPGTQGFVA